MDATDTQKQILKTFYTNWLMYMDGEKHIALRKKMQKPVNKVKKEVTSISDPLLLIFKNRIYVNQITGKSFIAMSLLYFIIAILYHPTISSMVVLYLVLILIDFIVVGLVIHSKNRKNVKAQ